MLTSLHLLPYLPFQKPHSLLCLVLFLDALPSLDFKLLVSQSLSDSPFLQLAHLRVFQIFSFKLSPENNLHLAIFSKVFLLTLLKPLFALDNVLLWDLVCQKVISRPTQPSFHWGLCGKSWTLSSKKSSLGALRSSTLWGNMTGYVRPQVYHAQFFWNPRSKYDTI